MTFRTAILSGVAALALSSASAIAQSDDYNRYGGGPAASSPGEQQQTEELNAQGLNGTTSSPAELNGAATPYSSGASTDEAGAYQQGSPSASETQYGGPPPQENAPVGDAAGPPSGPQTQYDVQQQQYQQQMQRYGSQQQNYQNERQRYAQDIRDYDVAQ
jgi:hypothetical protein